MATAPDRAVSIVDAAVINGASTPAQRQRILSAYATLLPAGATTVEIARLFVTDVREYIVARVRQIESEAAARTVNDQIIADLVEQP